MKTEEDEEEYKSVNSPFKWVGGKSRLRSSIISILPPHSCYVEVFGGAGWVLLGKSPSDVEVLNDLNQELITFFKVVKEKPEQLIESFDLELVARAEFDRLAELEPSELNEIQRAHRFYYLIMASWGGEWHYHRFQTSISDGGHGNRLIGALKYLRKRIEPVHARLKTVIIENMDWKDCVSRYDSPKTVMYLDPPYPDNKVNYAHQMRSWEEHQGMADILRKTKCNWIVSSFDTERVREIYSDFHIISVEAFSGMRVKKDDTKRFLNKEVLVVNFKPTQMVSVNGNDKQFNLSLEQPT